MFKQDQEKRIFTKRVLFIGIPDMAYVCLDGLKISEVNIVGVVGPKKDHVTYSAFRDFVLSRELEFIEYDDLTEDDFIQRIRALEIDLAVVCSFNYKVPKKLLDSVRGGFVNLHPSLLPYYRGANPYSQPIINNEEFSGVTLHFMNEHFDKGDIIVQQKLQITPRETMGTLFNRTNLIGLEMLIKVLGDFEKGDLPRFKQEDGDYPLGKTIPEEMLFINYENTAGQIERFIRALNPFLGASTIFRNTFIKIFSAEAINVQLKTDYVAGTIVRVDEDKFYIKTVDGVLSPTVLQFGSFFTGSAKDFIRMLNPKVGEKFGG